MAMEPQFPQLESRTALRSCWAEAPGPWAEPASGPATGEDGPHPAQPTGEDGWLCPLLVSGSP